MMIQSKQDIDYKRIGSHIRQLRIARKETQKEVAADINMQYTSYSNYERGSESFPLWRIAQLCERFEVSLGSVLDDCSPAFLPEWKTDAPNVSEHEIVLEELYHECSRLSLEYLKLLVAFAKDMNEQRSHKHRQ